MRLHFEAYDSNLCTSIRALYLDFHVKIEVKRADKKIGI